MTTGNIKRPQLCTVRGKRHKKKREEEEKAIKKSKEKRVRKIAGKKRNGK